MPTIRRSPALPLFALSLLAGCADMAMEDAGAAAELDLQERGQTVLFVGTDPVSLETDLYLAKALAEEGQEPPGLLAAEGFEVERLGLVREGITSGLFGDAADLFSLALPYAVPDRDGTHIALVTTPAANADLWEGPVPGRAGVFALDGSGVQVTGDVPGLSSVQFSDGGAWLFLTSQQTDGQPLGIQILPSDALDAEPLTADGIAGLPAGAQVVLAGAVRDTDDFLVLARPEGEHAAVYRVDPDAAAAELLSGAEDGNVTAPALSPSGAYLAATVSTTADNVRRVVIFDLEAGTVQTVSDPAAADCSWPAWAPSEAGVDRLAYVCQSLSTQRPDVALWPPDDMTTAAGYLTDRNQPAIVGGSMDGQVVRSRPQWDPQGEFLVFGAAAADDLDGELTLLVLPLGASVYPIYQGPQGSVGWAHFSALAGSGELLVWDRGATGLQASAGRHPIQVVPTDSPNPNPRGVDLGRDLLVSYPLFLGQNTMLYP
jgi:hypothetical protein